MGWAAARPKGKSPGYTPPRSAPRTERQRALRSSQDSALFPAGSGIAPVIKHACGRHDEEQVMARLSLLRKFCTLLSSG
jgi:hypothetical protein